MVLLVGHCFQRFDDHPCFDLLLVLTIPTVVVLMIIRVKSTVRSCDIWCLVRTLELGIENLRRLIIVYSDQVENLCFFHVHIVVVIRWSERSTWVASNLVLREQSVQVLINNSFFSMSLVISWIASVWFIATVGGACHVWRSVGCIWIGCVPERVGVHVLPFQSGCICLLGWHLQLDFNQNWIIFFLADFFLQWLKVIPTHKWSEFLLIPIKSGLFALIELTWSPIRDALCWSQRTKSFHLHCSCNEKRSCFERVCVLLSCDSLLSLYWILLDSCSRNEFGLPTLLTSK